MAQQSFKFIEKNDFGTRFAIKIAAKCSFWCNVLHLSQRMCTKQKSKKTNN
jgi:hypothetical protein